MQERLIDPDDLKASPALNRTLNVRLTEDERAALETAARTAGVPASRLLRAVLRGALRRGLAIGGRVNRPLAGR